MINIMCMMGDPANFTCMSKAAKPVKLTPELIRQLRKDGYKYVLVKDYAVTRKVDLVELSSFLLVPVKKLPTDPGQKEIFAPLNSKILAAWAAGEDGVVAYVECLV